MESYLEGGVAPAGLSRREIEHITDRDSFYMASVNEEGWPYVQHRGGEVGFVKIVDRATIGWIERTGNRQYLGAGNVTADPRVSLIFVDYPNRTRLKVRGLATHHRDPTPDLISSLDGEGLRIDGAFTVEIVAFDWNCPKYITPRYTLEMVESVSAPLHERIAELERELARLT